VNLQICDVTAGDKQPLLQLLSGLAIFEMHELRVAEELIAEALAGSQYYFIHVAREAAAGAEPTGRGRVVGYVCHGHNPVTDAIYDLYWIAVDRGAQGQGVGRKLIAHTEERVRAFGGRGIVIETSNRPEYAPARRLYERCGYRMAAELKDFYKPGEDRLEYVKFFGG
jgi:ribosomal protein S18 acetylase RimI-like enzyme